MNFILVFPLLLVAGIVGVVFPIEDTPSYRYEGHFGAEPSGNYYDNLTPAEHDALGEWWNNW
jgi:hypothetical protein